MLTKDSVTVSVDAVVYYRVSNATVSVANVENAHHSTRCTLHALLLLIDFCLNFPYYNIYLQCKVPRYFSFYVIRNG